MLTAILAATAIESEVRAKAFVQESAGMLSAAAVVKPQAFVSLEPVPREREFQAAVVMEIARGYHMNSHKPSEEYLIPTTLAVQPATGVQVLDTIYPEGQLLKFSFSPDKPLSVYTGKVILKLRLSAQPDAPLGEETIPTILRYQACNDTTCLPPVKVPVSITLEIATAGTSARTVHPEIFQTTDSSQRK